MYSTSRGAGFVRACMTRIHKADPSPAGETLQQQLPPLEQQVRSRMLAVGNHHNSYIGGMLLDLLSPQAHLSLHGQSQVEALRVPTLPPLNPTVCRFRACCRRAYGLGLPSSKIHNGQGSPTLMHNA